jgi:hypothetical protein
MDSLCAKGMYDRCRTLDDVKDALTEQLEKVAILQARGYALNHQVINDVGYMFQRDEPRVVPVKRATRLAAKGLFDDCSSLAEVMGAIAMEIRRVEDLKRKGYELVAQVDGDNGKLKK